MVSEVPLERAVREAFAIVPYAFEFVSVVRLVAPVELRKWQCGAENSVTLQPNSVTLQPQDIDIRIRSGSPDDCGSPDWSVIAASHSVTLS
jgi:hypothetical protein